MLRKLAALLFSLSNAFAWNPSYSDIEGQAPQTAFSQLQLFQSAAHPEHNVYLNAGIIFLPLPSQSALATEWGIHDGFAFRQAMGLWIPSDFEKKKREGFAFGFGWFGERHGWDSEDFLFVPHRGNFARINQVHTFGFTASDSSKHLLLGGGLQYINAKDDAIRWWLLGTYDRFSIVPVFHKADLQALNAKIDLQARQVRGQEDSWQNYLPDLEVSFYSKDSVKMSISQNVFKQKFYLEGALWASSGDFAWAAFKFYPDPSRVHLALEATAAKKESGDVYFGGGITLPILRVAYNHYDYCENFFKSRGVWIAEFRLSIGTSGDSFVTLSSPKAAENEISRSPARRQK